ncbi:CPBP family intramembrane metalloprotease [Clostridium botulinum]|uniref:CAAX prenyl protease 2/Lysostaphin resistance protein A-like domain-containing protein n=3 Tax=Clostridium botulinum TaxID=1491 RepID=A5I6V6_CLOBH|nr:CPBP family intramembrane glutamic endopeptidase [Clostridium botulinum]EPS49298.1 CAAX amino terminal protease family protein [Clostridium botulinum CFSAN002369]EPS50414.1 CAAX amino terminal protease family protein [Clostridium botulinum CFSAN002367]ABS34417.1 CAAX amino terminal protease family protein [Clostridium botulinum A str. ATCC 19397]ABS37622.1 CAAX amino terminal protease family protein [Clostridium botulinum A str. Hall]ACO84156.1 CAAX amino terminal protease family protein [C
MELIKSILTFIILWIPPIILFFRIKPKKSNIFISVIIFIVYIIGSLFTQNFFPFVLTLMDIFQLRKRYGLSEEFHEFKYNDDYHRFKFNISSFSFIKGIQYALISYLGYILIMIIFNIISNSLKLNLKEQDVVTWLSSMPLNKFLIVIPVTVIFAPVAEEFVFRWYIFEKLLNKRLGIVLAAIISSILFGIVHFNVKVFPALVFIAVFNCYLIHKEGFWYAVFNHFVFNFVNTTMIFLTKL